MAALVLDNVTTSAFSIAPSLAAGVLTVRLQGTGDTAAVPPLESYLDAAGKEIPALRVHAVVFDVRALYLLTSSALKALLSFIFRLVSDKYPCRVQFVVDSHLSWQRRCLIAIVRMAPHLVAIEDG
jgi:hypothetical protein